MNKIIISTSQAKPWAYETREFIFFHNLWLIFCCIFLHSLEVFYMDCFYVIPHLIFVRKLFLAKMALVFIGCIVLFSITFIRSFISIVVFGSRLIWLSSASFPSVGSILCENLQPIKFKGQCSFFTKYRHILAFCVWTKTCSFSLQLYEKCFPTKFTFKVPLSIMLIKHVDFQIGVSV